METPSGAGPSGGTGPLADDGPLAAAAARAGAVVRTETRPGDIGSLIRLHGVLYAAETGYSMEFEAYVAKTFSGYRWPLGARERLWLVEKDGTLAGSIAIVKASETQAQLRWLLLDARLRGRGIGRALVQEAVTFARAQGYASIVLWTEDSLVTAASLYRQAGFTRTEESTAEAWGAVRTQSRWDLVLA